MVLCSAPRLVHRLLGCFFWSLIVVGPLQAQQPLAPGTPLPSIGESLQRVDGSTVRLEDVTGSRGTVFLFWSNRCPWVDKYEGRVQDLVADVRGAGIHFVRVNANDAREWPIESLAASRTRAERRDYRAPYVRDSTAALARVLGATRTPHAFLFDGEGTLVYAGAIDDSPGDPEQVSTAYLRDALEALINDTAPPVSTTKAFGCTLKYPEDPDRP